MSEVRFVVPELKLGKLIHAPGGVTVADAMSRAAANLESIKPTCRAELMALLDQAEAVGAADCDPEQLYSLAVRGIGVGAVCGVPQVDGALNSFCDLLVVLQAADCREREPVAVHLQAWRLLMDPTLAGAGAEAIVAGLRKVGAYYAQSLTA